MTILSSYLALKTGLATATGLATSLVAVTFGWVPSEPAADGVQSAGYDYLVKLSAEDLEALRDGRAESLVSELPTDVGPIDRVRIYVGEGEAPQRWNDRDRLSPQRIAAASAKAKSHTVAKPVIPEWEDASRLVDGTESLSETAERHTVYQNPNSLQQGFEDATRPLTEAGQWIDSQTRELLEKSGDSLRNGTEDLLNGTGDVLEKIADPYGSRPTQYDANGYPQEARVDPPAMSPNAAQQAQYQQNTPLPGYPANSYPPSTPPLAQPNSQSTPNYPAAPPNSGGGLFKSFASETDPNAAMTRRQMTPVPRAGAAAPTNPTTPTSQSVSAGSSDPWAPYNGDSDPYSARREPVTTASSPSGFPELPSRATNKESAWPSTTAPGGGFASGRATAKPTPDSAAAPQTGWTGASLGPPASQPAAASPAPAANLSQNASTLPNAGTGHVEKFLLVILGAATCFTWIAYIDVRNKYRSVLRNSPGGGYSTAA